MIGIIPSSNKTFEVYGDFNSKDLIEGKLYYDPGTERVYMYSKTETRSNPNTGYFPVWDGQKTYVSAFSNKKYLNTDVTKLDIESMCSSINKDIANRIIYMQRRSDNNDLLKPQIVDGDNMFTQCIKGVITNMNITMVDLIDMAPDLQEKAIENYYSALTKITFMRLDKWNIWTDYILHVNYKITIYKDDKRLMSYKHPKDEFDTGIVKYDNIISTKDDPFKKIIKILIIMENINKSSLRSDEVDDYTINNMLTTINGTKPLSAQLFSRFIRMARLSYMVNIFNRDGKEIFEYNE